MYTCKELKKSEISAEKNNDKKTKWNSQWNKTEYLKFKISHMDWTFQGKWQEKE